MKYSTSASSGSVTLEFDRKPTGTTQADREVQLLTNCEVGASGKITVDLSAAHADGMPAEAGNGVIHAVDTVILP